ncbi:MAG: ATP-binding cassette domain-containing protein [Candidatus Omnitrophota bacterium]|nr:ATP-binding cassette domain-containing protein [Candidatus Omnitrophota bacterium]
MRRKVLEFQKVGKRFRIYQVQKTLFRLGKSLAARIPFKRDLWVLQDISLNIKQGEKVALIGRNGAGKTTFFRVASGIYPATTGTVRRTVPISPLFRYGIGMNPHLPVIDNVYILGAFYGLSAGRIKRKLEEIIDFCELEKLLYLPVKNLSSGQVQRLSFSVFAQSDDAFLAFDESASLADARFQKKCDSYFKQLMTSDKTILIASHNQEILSRYCGRAIWLEEGRMQAFDSCGKTLAAYGKFCQTYNPAEVVRSPALAK